MEIAWKEVAAMAAAAAAAARRVVWPPGFSAKRSADGHVERRRRWRREELS
jgi:hypothetical protein